MFISEGIFAANVIQGSRIAIMLKEFQNVVSL